MKFTSYGLKRRPDQTVNKLNSISTKLGKLDSCVQVKSADGKSIIIIGNQPIDPDTGKPYAFGINKYKILGDRLELEGTWTM